jgi:hypothetical protein
MRTIIAAAIASCVVLLASSASADVRLTITNGHVTLSAKDATVRQILTEWARVGQTTFVNADKISGAPVTLELADVSEELALDVILRSVSGYLAAPRASTIANASRYDRVLVMPTSVGTKASAAPPPTFQQPQFNPPPVDDDADDDDAAPQARPGGVMPNGGFAPGGLPRRGPLFNGFPPGQGPNPNLPGAPPPVQAPVPTPAQGVITSPVMPGGVSIPGMVVPVPAQPGQPGGPVPGQETP